MRTMIWIPVLAAAALAAAAQPADAQTVTRGPYLQQGTSNAMTLRWRTSAATNSRVRYGTAQGSLTQTADDPASTTEHVVRITGLSAETRYYYSVGTTSATLAGNDANHFFVTPPNPGTARPTRIWVIGDAGTANSSQAAVRDAYYSHTGTRHTDLWLMLGDNAYNDGTDSQYQNAVFSSNYGYSALLRKSVVWPTLGNHDGHSTTSGGTGPYYDIFTLPRNAEAGGLPSGTEAYYSFDHGNIHFICLDSYQQSRAVGGPMHTWCKNDVQATTRDWIIAYWHHPPYTKGSHNSDSESALVDMRKNFLPILEDGGVDLVLGGHSHSYERSFLLDGHYGTSGTLTNAMKKDGGSGRDAAAYKKSTGTVAHEGAVYAVAGSSGKTSGGSLNHAAMFISLNQLGSMVIDIDGDRLDARFLRSDGSTGDYFSIVKGGTPPPAGDTTPPTVTITTPTTAPTHATSSSPITIGGSASDNVGVTQVTWANAATNGTGGATGTTSWSAVIALAAGANAITVTARDAAGNTAADTITVTYTPPAGDSTPPQISIVEPSTGPTFDAPSEPVTVSGTASDNVGVVTVTWSNAATGESGTASGTTDWSASIELASGANVITVTAYDGAGNSTSATITVNYTPPAGGGGTVVSVTSEGRNGDAWVNDRCPIGALGAGTPGAWTWLAALGALAWAALLRRR